MDLNYLRNVRLNFRQQEPSHSMENVLYIELRMRGFSVDVGNVCISERNSDGYTGTQAAGGGFVCNKGSKRYYIQSAYRMDSEEKKSKERPRGRSMMDSESVLSLLIVRSQLITKKVY